MIKVAVAGLGRVSSDYDVDWNGAPRSHIGAILATEGLALVALIDPSAEAQSRARTVWSALRDTTPLPGLEELAPGMADIVVLATPPGDRERQVAQAIVAKPRILFVEKPLAADTREGQRIIELARRNEVTLRVNFPRRFDPALQKTRQKQSGRPQKVVMRYGKGLTNYGSHLVDFLIDWFGAVTEVQAFGPDPGPEGALTFCCRMAAGFDAVIVGIGGLDYDQFEIDMFYPDRRVEFAALSIERNVYRPVPDRLYKNYTHLSPIAVESDISPIGGLIEVYRAMREHLLHNAALSGCTGEDALHGIAVIEFARRSAATGGRAERLDIPLAVA